MLRLALSHHFDSLLANLNHLKALPREESVECVTRLLLRQGCLTPELLT
jgi:hypothetical protein